MPGNTRNTLNAEQREQLLVWLTADYPDQVIQGWFRERGWPRLTAQNISHYRISNREKIEAARRARVDSALNQGLALKEERVAALVAHAESLASIKWVPDEKGKLRNEKAWRETLDDIAREMGDRRAGVDLGGQVEVKRYENVDTERV